MDRVYNLYDERYFPQDFVAQQYLEKMTIHKGDSQQYEYKWGPRAEYEVSRRDVLEFISRVFVYNLCIPLSVLYV